MQIGTLLSIQVGNPTSHPLPEATNPKETWCTSFFRTPSPQPRKLYITHLEGNEQADKKNHGQPDQAVLLYANRNYPLWREELDRPDMGPGGFGENFTVEELTEQTVSIGDIYAIGDARIQVTGPRYPCFKIERRWGLPGLTARTAATGRTGWYCRVLEEGIVEPGLPLNLVERPYPAWTIALVNDLGHGRNKNIQQAQELAACPLLNIWWQDLVVHIATSHSTIPIS
jgi:MOSC domain-containing protein YiiM